MKSEQSPAPFEKSNKKEALESGYEFGAIESLRKPMEKIFTELRPEIDKGSYNLIIGDDASGRIPALIFNSVIRELYKEKNYPNPAVYFVAGSKELGGKKEETKKSLVNIYISKIREDIMKRDIDVVKALIVTDTIATGSSLMPIAESLKRNNVDFDVATIGIVGGNYCDERKKEIEKRLGAKIVWGLIGTPAIYQHYSIGGVRKSAENLFSDRLKEGAIIAEAGDIQKDVNIARDHDIKLLTSELVDWYRSEENSQVREINH